MANGPPFGAAERSNILTVDLDQGASPGGRAISLRVVGIEDLLAAEVRGWVSQGATDVEAATRTECLSASLARGVGGRLRGGYVQRRLPKRRTAQSHSTHRWCAACTRIPRHD